MKWQSGVAGIVQACELAIHQSGIAQRSSDEVGALPMLLIQIVLVNHLIRPTAGPQIKYRLAIRAQHHIAAGILDDRDRRVVIALRALTTIDLAPSMLIWPPASIAISPRIAASLPVPRTVSVGKPSLPMRGALSSSVPRCWPSCCPGRLPAATSVPWRKSIRAPLASVSKRRRQ